MATRLTQTGQEVQEILDSAVEIFWAIFGESTYAEIDAAAGRGALVCCKYGNVNYVYSGIDNGSNSMVFSQFGADATNPEVGTLLLNIGSGQWSVGNTIHLENASNKTKSTDTHPESALSSDTQYLSGKATGELFVPRTGGAFSGTVKFNNSVEIDAQLDMDGNRIKEVGTPTQATDAATKAYVDTTTQAKATHFEIDVNWLSIRIDQRYSFLRLDVRSGSANIGQIVVATGTDVRGVLVSATKGIKENISFYTFSDNNSHGHLAIGSASGEDNVQIDVATLSGETPTINIVGIDELFEDYDPVPFTAVSYLADDTDLAGKADIAISRNVGGGQYLTIDASDKCSLYIRTSFDSSPDGYLAVIGGSETAYVSHLIGPGESFLSTVYLRNDTIQFKNGGGSIVVEVFVLSGSVSSVSVDDEVMTYDETTTIVELQEKLISGVNLKTINGSTILGSGNLEINGTFKAEYGTTTYAEVSAAFNAGKVVTVDVEWTSGYETLYLTSYNGDTGLFFFSSPVEQDMIRSCYVDDADNWGNIVTFEPQMYALVTALSSGSDDFHYPSAKAVYDALATKASATIETYIPAQASAQNQLADKNFVNSSIQTATATFKGNWETWADVPDDYTDYPDETKPDNNDYMVLRDASGYAPAWSFIKTYASGDLVCYDDVLYKSLDSHQSGHQPDESPSYWERVDSNPAYEGTWRFKYNGSWDADGKEGWRPEYQVNEKPLTAAQLAALNSGITDTKVAKLDALPATIPTEVFVATYGTTTYAEINTAISAGKVVVCFYNTTRMFVLAGLHASSYVFTEVTDNTIYSINVTSASVWSYTGMGWQKVSDLVKSTAGWSSTPSDSKYPSEKLVYDSLGKKVGVESQSFTDAEKAQARSNIGALTSVSEQAISDPTNGYYTKAQSDAKYEAVANKVTSIGSSSTDSEYPSAKCMYDLIGDVETLINAL